MSKKIFENHTLERVWIHVLKELVASGVTVRDNDAFLELQNIQISYSNPFELETPNYATFFGTEFSEYIHRVYSPGGDSVTGRNYYKIIYENQGINQVQKVIQQLKKNPLTRSATVVLVDPKSDKLPCVTEVNFSIREKQLQMTVLFKSSDFAKKFIPDMIELSRIHKFISSELLIGRGRVTAQILCAQLYISDKKIVTKILLNAQHNGYFKTEKIIENWNKEAAEWDKNILNPSHYVNIENGYARFVEFLVKNIKKPKSPDYSLALDSGSGTGVISRYLSKKGYKVYGVDISPEMLEYASKTSKINYICANSIDLPFKDAQFDLVCSRGVLVSHVGKEYTDIFLKEQGRVLKSGGLFMFDFITHFNTTETKKRKSKAYFSFSKMSSLLEKHGFEVLERSGDDINRVNSILCKKL